MDNTKNMAESQAGSTLSQDEEMQEMTFCAEVEATLPEKPKASNFPISTVSVGAWKRVHTKEGELTAKLYFARKKLIWEILDGQLKSKMEVAWSDIIAIRALMLPNQPGLLEIELRVPPLFFRELPPRPGKHSTWQKTSDFTGGQAQLIRRHLATFPPGELDKHYEKLLESDENLLELSKRPFPSKRSPYFNTSTVLSFNNSGEQTPLFNPQPQLHYPTAASPLPPQRSPYFSTTGTVLSFNNSEEQTLLSHHQPQLHYPTAASPLPPQRSRHFNTTGTVLSFNNSEEQTLLSHHQPPPLYPITPTITQGFKPTMWENQTIGLSNDARFVDENPRFVEPPSMADINLTIPSTDYNNLSDHEQVKMVPNNTAIDNHQYNLMLPQSSQASSLPPWLQPEEIRRKTLFNKVVSADSKSSTLDVLNEWVAGGETVNKADIVDISCYFRSRKNYRAALQLYEWMDTSNFNLPITDADHAIRIELLRRVEGTHSAETYLDSLPEKTIKNILKYAINWIFLHS